MKNINDFNKETHEVNDNIIMDKSTNLSYPPYEIFNRTILASNNNTVNNWYKNNEVINFVYHYVVDIFRYMKLNNKGKFSNELIEEIEIILSEMKSEKDKAKYFVNTPNDKCTLTNIEILFYSVFSYHFNYKRLTNKIIEVTKNYKIYFQNDNLISIKYLNKLLEEYKKKNNLTYYEMHKDKKKILKELNIMYILPYKDSENDFAIEIYELSIIYYLKHSFGVNGIFSYKRIIKFCLYAINKHAKSLVKSKVNRNKILFNQKIISMNNIVKLDKQERNEQSKHIIDNCINNCNTLGNYINYTNDNTNDNTKSTLYTNNSNNRYIEKVISLLELNIMNDLTLVYNNHLSFRFIDERFNKNYKISKHFNNLYEKAIYLIENYHFTYDIIAIRKLRRNIQKEYRQYETQQKENREQQKENREQQKVFKEQQKEKQLQEDFNKTSVLEVYELFYNVASNLGLTNQYLNKLEYIKQNINKVTSVNLYQMYKLTQTTNRKELYKNCIGDVYKRIITNVTK